MRRRTILERWINKTTIAGPDDCWTWNAARDRDGYGKFQHGPKGAQVHIRAHRWIIEHLHGPIPAGMVVMHTCDNPPCVNPSHLRLGTPLENVADRDAKGRGAPVWGRPLNRLRQTHCHNGHPFDEINTYVTSNGHRMCKACGRENQRRYYHRKKAS
jgi:hypothetical protein